MKIFLRILTGAGSGIGKAVCQVFAREGALLAAVDVNQESAHKTIDSLPKGMFVLLMSTRNLHISREYARGRRERRNRFRPADVAFFSSESDKNVALIFRKIRCFNIHFNIHTCHQLVFDPRRSSTRSPSGLHKKSIRGKGPVWEGS